MNLLVVPVTSVKFKSADEVFNPSRWAYNFGLISVRGLMGGLGGWGGGGLIIVCTSFPGRWAYNFGAYKWQFMVIHACMCNEQ